METFAMVLDVPTSAGAGAAVLVWSLERGPEVIEVTAPVDITAG